MLSCLYNLARYLNLLILSLFCWAKEAKPLGLCLTSLLTKAKTGQDEFEVCFRFWLLLRQNTSDLTLFSLLKGGQSRARCCRRRAAANQICQNDKVMRLVCNQKPVLTNRPKYNV